MNIKIEYELPAVEVKPQGTHYKMLRRLLKMPGTFIGHRPQNRHGCSASASMTRADRFSDFLNNYTQASLLF
jgi:hypothetical protein